MNVFYFIFQQTMFFTIPLMIVALGGLFSEKSGIVNIALEGKMVLGAFAGILTIATFQEQLPGTPILIIALIVATLTGTVISLFHAYASIHLNADQVISGIAINMFAPALVIYLSRLITGTQLVNFTNQFRIEAVPFLSDIPVIGQMFFRNTYLTTFLGFGIMVIGTIILFKTQFGLRLRACGEHPGAADSVGINVAKIRYIGVITSGALAGFGGLVLIIPSFSVFSGSVSGYGFLALAVLIFGGWNPVKIIFAAFFFGLLQATASSFTAIDFLRNLNIPPHFFRMTPYVATLLLLSFTSKNTVAPKALGQVYDKGKR